MSTVRTVAIQMDPPQGFKTYTDSTIVLGLEAQRRGFDLYYYHPSTLAWDKGSVVATLQPLRFFTDESNWFSLGEPQRVALNQMDVVLMRQDPPFDMGYITTTYLLEMLKPEVLVLNDPTSVRDCPEKIFPLLFAEFMPPTLVTSEAAQVRAFLEEYGDIVLKPLYGYAGLGVFHLKQGGDNIEAILETLFHHNREPFMAQRFLPEVSSGDCRIVLMDGKVEAVLGRIPAQGEIRANFRAGGSAAQAALSPRQREICDVIGPELARRNLLMVGLDVIGDYLTEINVTSPTGLPAIKRLYDIHPEKAFWDAVEKRLT